MARVASSQQTSSGVAGFRRWLRPLILLMVIGGGTALWYQMRTETADPLPTIDDVVAHLDRGDFEAAFAAIEPLVAEQPDNPEFRRLLASVYAMKGDASTGVRLLSELPGFDNSADLHLSAAELSIQIPDPEQALMLARRATELAPDQSAGWQLIATVETLLFHPTNARQALRETDRLGQMGLIEVLSYTAGDRVRYDLDANLLKLSEARRADPNNMRIRFAYAMNLLQADRRREMRELLQQTSPTNNPDAWWMDLAAAEMAIVEKRYDDTQASLERLGEHGKLLPRVWLLHGRLARRRNQTEQALTAFRNAAALDPFDPEPPYVISQLLGNNEAATEEAVALLTRARQLQDLHVLISSTLVLDNVDEVADRFAGIVSGYLDIGALREANLCLRWIAREGYQSQDSRAQQQRLNQQIGVATARLIPPRPDRLVPLPTSSASESASPLTDLPVPPPLPPQDRTREWGVDFTYRIEDDRRHPTLSSLGGGIAAVDYDLDGQTDLYFVQGGPLPDTADRANDQDAFYRGSVRGFRDIRDPALTGDDGSPVGLGFGVGVTAGDVNCDGFPDLYIAAYGENTLLLNQGDGTYQATRSDVVAGAADRWSTTPVITDFNGDGNPDIFVVNYLDYSVQAMLKAGDADADDLRNPPGPRLADGEQDRLYLNLGNGTWRDETAAAGLTVPDGKGLGAVVADFNRDGRPDIFVGNDTTPNRLYQNTTEPGGAARFEEVSVRSGVAVSGSGNAEACMGLAADDVDGNGLPDLFITNFHTQTNTLYRNLGEPGFIDRTDEYGLSAPSFAAMGWGTVFYDMNADGRRDLLTLNGWLFEEGMRPQIFLKEERRFVVAEFNDDSYWSAPAMGRVLIQVDLNGDLRPDLAAGHLFETSRLLSAPKEHHRTTRVTLVDESRRLDLTGLRAARDDSTATEHFPGGYLGSSERALYVSGTGPLQLTWPDGATEQIRLPSEPVRVCLVRRSDGSMKPFLLPAPAALGTTERVE